MPYEQGVKKQLIQTADLDSGYIEFMKNYLNMNLLKKKNCEVLLDIMHGVGNGYVERLFKGTNIKVDTMHKDADVSFAGIAPEPIEKKFEGINRRMKNGGMISALR